MKDAIVKACRDNNHTLHVMAHSELCDAQVKWNNRMQDFVFDKALSKDCFYGYHDKETDARFVVYVDDDGHAQIEGGSYFLHEDK